MCCEWLYVFTISHLDSVQNGVTALQAASYKGHYQVVQILIAAKASINIQNKVRVISNKIHWYNITVH